MTDELPENAVNSSLFLL